MNARLSTLLAAASSVVVIAGCGDVKGAAPPAPRPVKVMEARAPEATPGARYAVSIQPNDQVARSFKSGGYVDSVLRRNGADGRPRLLQAGDFVRAGTVVAQLREADYRDHVLQARASLQELEASQTKSQFDLDRAQYLFAAGALTKPDRDAAQAAVDAGTARIQSARAQISLAVTALNESALVAPTDGVVLERKIEIGSLVGAGTVAFTIGNVSSVKAVFGVPDSIVNRITPGQALVVTTEAFRGSRFAGEVTTVAPSADPQSRVFDIHVTIANADGRLRPGMIGAVELVSDSASAEAAEALRRQAIAVPLSAIVRSAKSSGEYTLFVVEGQAESLRARARAVTLGPVQGNLVVITSGLQAGERVIVMGATLVVDGEAIRVIP